MSSMRNAVQRRNHRERAQPTERQKWGVLEKHKDYSLRAKDYNEKKKRLQILRRKAADRNPDEFHFGMIHSHAHGSGQKVADRGNPVLGQDAVKLLKTQDAGYLKTMVQQTRKARKRLEQSFTIRDGGDDDVDNPGPGSSQVQNGHMFFVDSVMEQKQFSTKSIFGSNKSGDSMANDPSSRAKGEQDDLIETDTEMDNRPSRPPRLITNSSAPQDPKKDALALRNDRALRKLRKRGNEARASQLDLLKSRERALLVAEQELQLQRAKMSNSVGGMTKAGIKWKPRERKK